MHVTQWELKIKDKIRCYAPQRRPRPWPGPPRGRSQPEPGRGWGWQACVRVSEAAARHSGQRWPAAMADAACLPRCCAEQTPAPRPCQSPRPSTSAHSAAISGEPRRPPDLPSACGPGHGPHADGRADGCPGSRGPQLLWGHPAPRGAWPRVGERPCHSHPFSRRRPAFREGRGPSTARWLVTNLG